MSAQERRKSIEFCRQSPTGEIVAIDLAEHMLAVGRENVRRLKLDGRIRLEKVNGRKMKHADGSFQAVMSIASSTIFPNRQTSSRRSCVCRAGSDHLHPRFASSR